VQAGSGGGGQVVSFELGDFVLIEGPDDSCWVAQLLEPYTGKLSEEVDDVDDDGPRISLRWLYTPDELPRYMYVCVCERGNRKECLFCWKCVSVGCECICLLPRCLCVREAPTHFFFFVESAALCVMSSHVFSL